MTHIDSDHGPRCGDGCTRRLFHYGWHRDATGVGFMRDGAGNAVYGELPRHTMEEIKGWR
jgi:hypothetical protein